MHRPTSQKGLKQIADKYGISLATANEIIRSQYEFLKITMNSCDATKDFFPTMCFVHLGKFIVTPQRRWCFKNIPKKIKEPKDDQRRHEILQSSDRHDGDAEEYTPQTTEG